MRKFEYGRFGFDFGEIKGCLDYWRGDFGVTPSVNVTDEFIQKLRDNTLGTKKIQKIVIARTGNGYRFAWVTVQYQITAVIFRKLFDAVYIDNMLVIDTVKETG